MKRDGGPASLAPGGELRLLVQALSEVSTAELCDNVPRLVRDCFLPMGDFAAS